MKYSKQLLIAATALVSTTSVFAEDLLLWQDNSLSLLVGTGYELDPKTQQTLTFEHASGWSVGDLFIFVDGINFNGDEDIGGKEQAYYGEIAPRFSAGKILDKDLSLGFIQDVNIATCYEFGQNSDDNYLVGIGFDLEAPGFDFFQLNFYRRYNDGKDDLESYQATAAWKITMPIGESALICDGFIDWVFGEGTDHLHICPQIKYDVGVLLGMEERSLFAGIEYDYWKNKYAVRNHDFGLDSDQSTFSWLIKYHF